MNRILFAAAFAAAFAGGASAVQENHVMATPDAIQWGPSPDGLPPGAQGTVLEGDPSQPGYFAVRVKAPAGYRLAPHTHPAVERVTVIEGTLYLAMGDKWDDKALKAYPRGSYLSMPKGSPHFAVFREPGVVQVATDGPWGILYVDPRDDPRRAAASPGR